MRKANSVVYFRGRLGYKLRTEYRSELRELEKELEDLEIMI
jgi:hypothetical protein